MKIVLYPCLPVFSDLEKQARKADHEIMHVDVLNSENLAEKEPDVVIIADRFNDLSLLKYHTAPRKKNVFYALYLSKPLSWTFPEEFNDLDEPKMRDFINCFLFSSESQRLDYIHRFGISVEKSMLLRPIIQPSVASAEQNRKGYVAIISEKKDLVMMKKIFYKKWDQVSLLACNPKEVLTEKDIRLFKTLYTSSSAIQFGNYEAIVALETSDMTSKILLQAASMGCLPICPEDPALREHLSIHCRWTFPASAVETMMLLQFHRRLEELEALRPDELKKQQKELGEYMQKNFSGEQVCHDFLNILEKRVKLYKEYVKEGYPKILQKNLEFYKEGTKTTTTDPYKELSDQFPDMNEYYVLQLTRGVYFYEKKEYDQARTCFKSCLSLKDDFQNNVNLALLEADCKRTDDFLRYGEKALSIEYNATLANKIALTYHYVDFHKAQYYYRRILQVSPFDSMALINVYELYFVTQTLDHCLQGSTNNKVLNELKDQMKLALLESIRTQNINAIYGLVSNMIMSLLYLEGISEEELSRNAKETVMMMPKRPDLVKIAARMNRFKKYDKIRLGYLLSDLKPHPVGYLLRLILQNTVYPDQFEIVVYSNTDTGDNVVYNAVKKMKHVRLVSLHEKSDDQALEIIVNDDLDILVEMMGFTGSNRTQIFHYKPARIVASYFAFPYTTGLKEIDYKITDAYASPEFTEPNYSEKLYRLPGCLQCFTCDTEAIKRYGTRTDPFTIHLCCFNNPRKFTPTVFRTFARILVMAPHAKLFLRYVMWYNCSFYKEAIRCVFIKLGVAREQIEINAHQIRNVATDRQEYLDAYNDIDVALDPFPYNGGITSHEALFMNTPLICIEGQDYRSRIGVSLLSNLGLTEYIAKNPDDYVQKTLDLIDPKNRDRLLDLHKNLRPMMQQRDMSDPVRFTKTMEEAFMDMKKQYFE